ncbi:MAG: pseudouridine synthase [Lachnospiraceae bacterium]
MANIRLDKFLADMQIGTRSQVKEIIRKGRVEVNNIKVMSTDAKISTDDNVKVDGVDVSYAEVEYYMLNKPAGVLSAARDKKQPTVLDLIPSKKRKDLFPVGRLDKDTYGLLLITNDGELAHKLLSPKSHVDKVYYAKINGLADDNTIKAFREGVFIEQDVKTMPAELEIISTDTDLNQSEIRLTIHEGKFHQVKRMFETQGMEVTFLKRLSMGSLELDESLEYGQYRPLTQKEINDLKDLTR